MKILHIIAGNLAGGAARGAYWLHQALVKEGIDSNVWTNSHITLGDERVRTTIKSPMDKVLNSIRSQLDANFQLFYPKRKKVIFSTGFFGIDFTKSREYKTADIIHFHWINGGFVNIKHISKIDKRIVWTMRDMWPMTGGCHYSIECDRYKYGCGNCKQLGSGSKYDVSKYILYRKKKYLPKNLKLVGISNWLSQEAKRSELFRNTEIKTIYNNIDTNSFFPIEKKQAREILGIKTDKRVILAGAQNINDFYKGFDKFLEAVNLLDREENLLLFFGKIDKSILDRLGFEYKSFGFLYDLISLRLVYSASDVFVAPSLMDAFGKTLAEAMACAVPVVCFDATGPKDIVEHKITGYKAVPFESEDLANGIRWVLNNENYKQLCKSAREKVITEFDSEIIAKKYIDFYKDILSE